MAFPTGALCNLSCDYCYYLEKDKIYIDDYSSFDMDISTLEIFVKKYIESQPGPVVEFGWQGGEAVLRGIDFFKKAVSFQKKYLPKGWEIVNNLQTNATLFNEEWYSFFKSNNFLLGISLDGPEHIHNKHRSSKNFNSYKKVVNTINSLRKHKINFNILTVVSDANVKEAKKIYKHFKSLGIQYFQFIPLVNESKNGLITKNSISGEEYGDFLLELFKFWIKDYGEVYIQIIEETLRAYMGYPSNLCVFSDRCGDSPVLEFNGDLYSCDHYVSENYLLGNIKQDSFSMMMNSNKQQKFAQKKLDELSLKCRECRYNFICKGGCPKNRLFKTTYGDKINYLCDGYYKFFSYTEKYMLKIKELILRNFDSESIKKELIHI